MVVAVKVDSEEVFKILKEEHLKTSDIPDETLSLIAQFYNTHQVSKLGISCFGPINLDDSSEDYGRIVNTPKVHWIGYNVIKSLKSKLTFSPELKVNVDVGCASYFEFKHGGWGVKKNLSFLTCGTGLGIGSVVNGHPCTGLTHPEGGH